MIAFYKIPTQIWKKLTRDENAISFTRKMEDKHGYHDASHQISFLYIVSDSNNTVRLKLIAHFQNNT